MSVPRIRVVVADDDPVFRAALRDVLAEDDRFLVVAERATGHGLGRVVADSAAHLVLVDVRMPSGGAVAVASALGSPSDGSAVAVVGLSGETSPVAVAAMFGAGATGFIAKGATGPDLPDLLARCVAGERVLGVPAAEAAVRRALSEFLAGVPEEPHALTVVRG
jgi:DNA-binding NarL/FixJ family response regulator